MSTLEINYLGRQDYNTTWESQRSLVARRLRGLISDTLLFVEHDPVFTIGRTGSEDNILVKLDRGTSFSVPVVHIDRGGDITFHGPGQLVGYPVLLLTDYYADLHRYLRDLEEVIIRTVADYGITSGREKGLTGVWVHGSKIASIGVKVTRWITMHGFALNVSPDLRYFDMINPCGLKECRTTSMRELIGETIPLKDVADTLAEHFRNIFVPKSAAMNTPAPGTH